jgi:hypothetical protein
VRPQKEDGRVVLNTPARIVPDSALSIPDLARITRPGWDSLVEPRVILSRDRPSRNWRIEDASAIKINIKGELFVKPELAEFGMTSPSFCTSTNERVYIT